MLSFVFFLEGKPIGFIQVVSGEQEGFSSGSVLEPKMPKSHSVGKIMVIHCSQARWQFPACPSFTSNSPRAEGQVTRCDKRQDWHDIHQKQRQKYQ